MTIDYRNTCDSCDKNLNNDGDEIHCQDCVSDLKEKIIDLEVEIDRLKEELKSIGMEG